MPDVLDRLGRGPWVWQVSNRWLVTTRNIRPRNAGMSETRRCGICGDYPSRDAAIHGAMARRVGIREQHARLLGVNAQRHKRVQA